MGYSKHCSKCAELKDISSFAKQERCADGHRAMCRQCYNTGRRSHYVANHEEKIAKRRIYESLPYVAEKRLTERSSEEYKRKQKGSAAAYKSRPEVAEAIKAQRAEYKRIPKNRAAMVLQAAKQRARKTGLPISLGLDWVTERVVGIGRCALTGLPFDFSGEASPGSRRNPFFPSIDQIEAGKGYTPENCRVVLVAVNLALCDWGSDQLVFISGMLLKHHGYEVIKDGKSVFGTD